VKGSADRGTIVVERVAEREKERGRVCERESERKRERESETEREREEKG